VSPIRRLLSRLRPHDRDLLQEIESHLAEAVEEYVQRGLSPADALAAARRDFGGVRQVREAHRDARRAPLVNELEKSLHDVRQALRMFPRQPMFTIGVVLILALGIGLVTSLLSLLNAQFYRPWQVRDPGSVAVIRALPVDGEPFGAISVAEYRYLRDQSQTIRRMAAWHEGNNRISSKDAGDFRVSSRFVNADYFDALGVGMEKGRGFARDEEDERAPKAVAIVSERLWRQRFGSIPDILGRTIRIDGTPFLVIGVAARGYLGVGQWGRTTDLWLPLPALALQERPVVLTQFIGMSGNGEVIAARLAPGTTRAAAAAELSVLSRQFRRAKSASSRGIALIDTRPLSLAGEPVPMSQLRTYLLCMFAASVVMLLACANVGNLLLARGMSRQREMAVRLSLGASRARLVRQLLTEALMLSTAAGTLGLVLAFFVPGVMARFGFGVGGLYGFFQVTDNSAGLNARYYEPDVLVFWLAMLLAGLTTVLAGLAPALRVTRMELAAVAAERHGRTPDGARLRFALLAGQIGLTTVLLLSAGLLTRGIRNPSSLSPGFPIDDLQAVSLERGGCSGARCTTFALSIGRAFEETDLAPVAISEQPPFAPLNHVMMARRPEDAPDAFHRILLRGVSRNYFRVLGIPIVRGRIPASDADTRELVVSEAAARELWPDAEPIGKTLLSAMSATEFETHEVVGVARDVPVRSMSAIEPVIYRTPTLASALLLRNSSPGIVARVRTIVATVEPGATVSGRPYASYLGESLGFAVVGSQVAWLVGSLGLFLAMVGAFGVFAYAVQSRRREIGIRMALGASGRQVVGLLLRTAGSATLWGLALGFAMVVALAPILRQVLYGLSLLDVVAYVEVIAILTVAVGLATWIPARRALVVDPATTLRAE
jgi:predicted permease